MTEKKGYFADCYVLTDKRTTEFIQSFLDKFVPNRHESADEYEILQYSDKPTIIFNTANELVDYLTENKNEIHTIYWGNSDQSDIRGAMCFFTNDGHLILGIYCDTMYPETTIEDKILTDLKSFCVSSKGYIGYEEPATHDTKEFLARIKSANAQPETVSGNPAEPPY